jgi:hypothetical protein
MHIIFSNPRQYPEFTQSVKVRPVETVTQFILLGIVVMICFYQPHFLVDIINQSFSLLPR